MMNSLKTVVLLGVMTALIMLVGGMLGGRRGMAFAFVLAAIMNFGSYWFSDKIVLAVYRAQEVTPGEAPELYAIVERLVDRANLPMPKVYVIPTGAPNAFATGRSPKHAAVAVTAGTLDLLAAEEVEGVLAHELAHVANRDILISAVAATMAGAIMLLATMARWALIFGGGQDEDDNPLALLLMTILAPLAAALVQMAISRSREYLADAKGAQLAGSSHGLANALTKLHRASQMAPLGANPSTAHLFIVNPLSGRSLLNLFSTHPPIEDRVARLRQISV